ncbi:hypothetical protein Hanom_Chr00s192832g01835561 [Helianthus anomalus]
MSLYFIKLHIPEFGFFFNSALSKSHVESSLYFQKKEKKSLYLYYICGGIGLDFSLG